MRRVHQSRVAVHRMSIIRGKIDHHHPTKWMPITHVDQRRIDAPEVNDVASKG